MTTTEPAMTPDLRAALEALDQVWTTFPSWELDPERAMLANSALTGWAVRVVEAYRASKEEPPVSDNDARNAKPEELCVFCDRTATTAVGGLRWERLYQHWECAGDCATAVRKKAPHDD